MGLKRYFHRHAGDIKLRQLLNVSQENSPNILVLPHLRHPVLFLVPVARAGDFDDEYILVYIFALHFCLDHKVCVTYEVAKVDKMVDFCFEWLWRAWV